MSQNMTGAVGGCAGQPQEFDLSNGDCRAVLIGLFNAALTVTTGNAVTRVRIGERWTDYSRGNYPQLVELYGALRQSCAASGADLTGLPNLAPGERVQRGGPGFFHRGRMPHF